MLGLVVLIPTFPSLFITMLTFSEPDDMFVTNCKSVGAKVPAIPDCLASIYAPLTKFCDGFVP